MTGSHVRYTWHVAYDPSPDAANPVAAAAATARSHGFPVTITTGVGAVAPWPNEPCLTITSYVERPDRGATPAALIRDAVRPGRFARALADRFGQEEVIWTEEYVTLNTTTRMETP